MKKAGDEMTVQESKDNIEAKMAELCAALKQNAAMEQWGDLDNDKLKDLLTVLIRIYASKVKAGIEAEPASRTELSQTDTSIFVDHLLRLVQVELFEVQMWRSIGSKY